MVFRVFFKPGDISIYVSLVKDFHQILFGQTISAEICQKQFLVCSNWTPIGSSTFFGGTTIDNILGFPSVSGSFQPSLRAEVAGALLILRTEAGELAVPAREVLLECRSVPLE